MGKIVWISLIIIVLLVGGFFGYEYLFRESSDDGLNNNADVKEKIIKCDYYFDSEGWTERYCYEVEVEKREIPDNLPEVTECDSIDKTLTYDKSNCYKKIAQQQRDLLVCEKISSENIDNLKSSYGSNTPYLRDECYAYVAFVMNDASICDDIVGPRKNGCIEDVGISPAYKDADCEAVREIMPSQVDWCYKLKAIQNEDYVICVDIESIEEKDMCYRYIAANKKDFSICQNIEINWIKELCLSEFE